jgi:hypothetical protein
LGGTIAFRTGFRSTLSRQVVNGTGLGTILAALSLTGRVVEALQAVKFLTEEVLESEKSQSC